VTRAKFYTVSLEEAILTALRSAHYGLRTAHVARLANACVLQTRSELQRLAQLSLVVSEGDDVCGLWRAIPAAVSRATKGDS
jgi:hypothetical protein